VVKCQLTNLGQWAADSCRLKVRRQLRH